MELSSHSTRESRENLNSKILENLKNLTVIFSNFENLTVKIEILTFGITYIVDVLDR